MTEPKNQPANQNTSKDRLSGKPVTPEKSTPLATRIENKAVINRLITFFETKA